MLTLRPHIGAYYNWSDGMLTTIPENGSCVVVYRTISRFQITKSLAPVSCLLAYQRRVLNGLAASSNVGERAMLILILDCGYWYRTFSTVSPAPPLRLMPATYTRTGTFSRLKTRKPSKMRLDRGDFLQALKGRACAVSMVLVISRLENGYPNGSDRNYGPNLTATFALPTPAGLNGKSTG